LRGALIDGRTQVVLFGAAVARSRPTGGGRAVPLHQAVAIEGSPDDLFKTAR
jgi:hypothetical protein